MKTVRISPSSLNKWELCPESWNQRYNHKRYEDLGLAAWVGISVHKAAESNYMHKAISHLDLPVEELVETASHHFMTETGSGRIHLSAAEEREGKEAVLLRARAEVEAATKLFAEQIAPGVQPITIGDIPAVELELWTRLEYPEHDLTVNLQLRIDCVSSEDGLIRIHDLKVKSKQADQVTWDRDLQFTLNWMALAEKMKTDPEEIVVDQIVSYKKGPKHIPVVTVRDARDIDAARNHVLAHVLGIEAGNYSPAPPGSWKCSPDWCGYWSRCPYVNPERVPALKDDKEQALKELLA